MYQRLLKIVAGLTVSACILLFVSKDALLRRTADRRIAAVEQRHGLHIGYRELTLEGLNTVCMRGLSVVPETGHDTLLTISHLDLQLDFWRMLTGHLQVKHVKLDDLRLNFLKNDSTANYDFLFRPSASPVTKEKSMGTDYARQAHRLLDWLYERMPDNGHITRLHVTEQHNHHRVSAYLPDMNIAANCFHTDIEITEDTLPAQRWVLTGRLSPAKRHLEAQLHAADRHDIRLPYLQRRFGADIRFDTLTCRLSETQDTNDRLRLDGQADIAGLRLYHTALSPDTIRLEKGSLDYRLDVRPQVIELDSSSIVRLNRLSFHPYIRLAHHANDSLPPLARWHVTASVNQPWFPAQDLFGSLPEGLFSTLAGIRTEGELAYHGFLDADFACIDSLKLASELKSRNFHILHQGAANLSKMNEEFEYTAYENGRPVRTFPVGPSWGHFTPLDKIPTVLQTAVMQSEDGAFFYHQGFLIDALREALIQDLKERRFARGGSTISMQLVKNVFLNRKKNITRKLEEALIVWLIESQRLTSKERMFEVYLNIAEWGPLVYGIGEASAFYFNKRPAELTVEESIFLASLIPHPKTFRYSFDDNGRLRESLSGYFSLIAERLTKKGIITEEEAARVRPQVNITGEARKQLME